ncbi:hypothetical protein Tdes44962_MAKER03181 [Teratosphaeria destructans]|uniref:Uncharacterized protein n=1 Tax=Teratosphaeria destructans TaxID=418781 RepID=A0A9W7SR25_9PEZI|nr:hypothetical protein Tdes44962_MAKER03181 [Teratosphaeria destructans]
MTPWLHQHSEGFRRKSPRRIPHRSAAFRTRGKMKLIWLLPLLASSVLGFVDKGWRCFPPIFSAPKSFGVCFPPLELQNKGVPPKSCGIELMCPEKDAYCDPDWNGGEKADCAGD